MTVVPSWANYRVAENPERESCGICVKYLDGRCSMFEGEPPVEKDHVCTQWQPIPPEEATMEGHEEAASAPELRYVNAPITHVEVRDPSANDDGTWTMSGYAAVFNKSTVLYDGKFLKVSESIDPGFFDDVLRSQPMGQPEGVVHYNLGHDMNRAVAATDVMRGMPGSLALRADGNGLFFLAKVDREDPDGLAMAVKMRNGVLKQASFAFTVKQAEWTDTENADGPDESHRRLMSAQHLYDVCACPQGAYSQTVSGLRGYAAAIGQLDLELLSELGSRGHSLQPDLGGAPTVSPVTGGGRNKRRLTSAQQTALSRYLPDSQ